MAANVKTQRGTFGDQIGAEQDILAKIPVEKQAFGELGTSILVTTLEPLPVGGSEDEGEAAAVGSFMVAAGRGSNDFTPLSNIQDNDLSIIHYDTAGRMHADIPETGEAGSVLPGVPDTDARTLKTGGYAVQYLQPDRDIPGPVDAGDIVHFLADLFGRPIVVMDTELPAGTNSIGTLVYTSPAAGATDTMDPLKTGALAAEAKVSETVGNAFADTVVPWYSDLHGRFRPVHDKDAVLAKSAQLSSALSFTDRINMLTGDQLASYRLGVGKVLFIDRIEIGWTSLDPWRPAGFFGSPSQGIVEWQVGVQVPGFPATFILDIAKGGTNAEFFANASRMYINGVAGSASWEFARPLALSGSIDEDTRALVFLLTEAKENFVANIALSVYGKLLDESEVA